MQIQREGQNYHVDHPDQQHAVFDMEFDMPSGPENVRVTIAGFQNPRALLTVLKILGSPENIDGTRNDILRGNHPCPLWVLDAIEANGYVKPPF